MLAGSPLAQAASTMVQAPAGRVDALRGKPAQEIRGHRQSRLFVGGRRRAVERVARCGAVLDRTGGEDFAGRQPPHKTLQILGMADPRSSAPPSRCHLPRRSLYAAQTDEGPRQAWLHAILHLLYLADAEVGAGAVSDRAHRLSGARLLSPEFLRQYAGYPALAPAKRRTLDVQIPRRARRHAVRQLRHLQRIRAFGI